MGVNVRFTTKTSESGITVKDTHKWQSYKKMQIVASFQQDLKLLKSDKNWQSCNFFITFKFFTLFQIGRL
jgi:hypothetical protein